jgi:hypothetical protein
MYGYGNTHLYGSRAEALNFTGKWLLRGCCGGSAT